VGEGGGPGRIEHWVPAAAEDDRAPLAAGR